MKVSIKKIGLKIIKTGSIVLGTILLLMLLVPLLFPSAVTKKINQWANSNINGHVVFSGTSLSFFKHFPALTLTLYDVTLKGSAPFEKDTLIAAKEIAFGIDVSSLFKSKVKIGKIYLSNAFINLQADSLGRANYYVYKSSAQKSAAQADSSSASLGIDQILIENSRLVYNDRSLPMMVIARNFNYTGSGDLSKDVFALHTHTQIQSLDLYYNKQPYILSKKVNADLVTRINTKSLDFVFQKNDLMINQLPVQFTGKFGFLKDGYDMDFKIDSHESDLSDIFTALPAEYQKMLEKTDVDGSGNLQISLKGKYIVKDKIMPDLDISLKIRNGYVNNQKSPSPVRNLFLNMESKLPGLNPDSLYVNVDSIYFNIGKDYFSSIIRVKGIKEPQIYAKVNTEIDLEKWNTAFGIKPFQVRGRYSLHLLAEGRYAKGTVSNKLKKVDTVITSIPKFTLTSSFKNGYFKYAKLPQAINNIGFNMRANCPDNNYKHISLAIDNLNASALNNYIKGYFNLANVNDFPVDAGLQAKFHLADLKQFLPADSIQIEGDLDANVKVKGKYIATKHKFPLTVADVVLKNGSIQTKYYPHPIQKINIDTRITNHTGTLNGTNVSIKPISFQFEGQPFSLKAELHNFANLEYDIQSKGTINIGKIYQVFAQKGYNVHGSIAANVALKGKQSDAVAGHYDKLQNSGTLKVKNMTLLWDMFPQPFTISKGDFSFNQDKMLFDSFTGHYGNSTMILNGNLTNVIDYAVKPGSILKGQFNLTSNLLVANDFMAYSGAPQGSSSTTGVIMVPKNLNLVITANVKKLTYNGLLINDAKSQMTINNGNINLKQTGFNLIGTPVSMDANYLSVSPQRAYFDYHINAKDFDIKKAYNKIKLFRDMATAAEHAEGLVSLDYQLSGRLNSDMQPVYASLKGGGVLSARQIKMHGFKLLNAIGNSAKRDSLSKNPDVSQIDIKTKIANNIITIERTKMRIAGFRARFEGQVSFDKKMDLQFRLGLPPLGIIGIPMNITGTQDKPKIRLGKGKKEDELQATNDDK
ncbi:AsmA protein [Mucilaginibacter gracilis]|uniref:AsmA protein n=1 Tax=Mucilaginibacter gracilis TaxID=423350 RepID=A0A495IYR0_9SPHI|nr:AsmA family protein [Mucilaginibacter gracilis]RKR80959.1 AsmA protein [Mucilaginibacter gracilis]